MAGNPGPLFPEDPTSDIRFRYQTVEFGDVDIHVRTLRDTQQVPDLHDEADALGISPASWALFGVIWPAGEALARLMFGYDVDGRRVLEVGCGIGLASLVLNRREADITATDQHPRAEAFLRLNAGLNDDAEIPFVRTDWVDDEDELGEFDLIIGSDLLYERDHVDALSSFIARHARATSEVLYVDGGRGMAGRFTTALTSFGFEATDDAPSMPDMVPPARGRVLRFRRNG